MKKIAVVLGVIVGLLVLGFGALWVLANPNSHRQLIQSQLESQLGRKVTLGDMSLGLFPFRFQVQNPVIGDDPTVGSQRPFVQAEKLDIQISLLPLLSGNINVNALELQRPSVELVKTKQGVWNFSTLGAKAAPATSAPSAPKSAGASTQAFALDRLVIKDGQVALTDFQQNRERAVYDHIDVTLLNFSADKPFSFDIAVQIEGGGPTPIAGVLSGHGDVTNGTSEIQASGNLKLDKAKINKVDVGYPISLQYKGSVKTADDSIHIDDAKLQLGQTPLDVSGMLYTSTNPVTMDLKIKSGDVSIAEIARLASAFGVAFAPGATVAGRVSTDVQAKGSFAKPVLSGTIAGRDLRISGQGIPQPVQVNAVNLALSPTAIQSNEFNATSGKTTVVGKLAVLQYASSSPSADVELRAPGATLPEIQSIAKAYGMNGLDQISGDGKLSFDLRAKGPIQSLSTTSAMRALNGTIDVDFSPMKILGFDTSHELAQIGGFGSSLKDQNLTDILKIAGKILIKDGIAQTDGLKAQLGVGALNASGTGDLATEALNLKMSAIFTKEFSDSIGGIKGGNVLNFGLSNSAGEIVLPAIVRGSFTKPSFAPDLKAMADLQKQKYIPSLSNPTEAITNVLGLVKKKDNTGQDQSQPPNAGGLKGLLDAFGGKKTDQSK
jgi:uncharacterized protein involved in outer membrane biogenesis